MDDIPCITKLRKLAKIVFMISKQRSHSQQSTDEREKGGKITDENKYFFTNVICDFGTLNEKCRIRQKKCKKAIKHRNAFQASLDDVD